MNSWGFGRAFPYSPKRLAITRWVVNLYEYDIRYQFADAGNASRLQVQANHEKLMLGKTEGSITNGQCRDTGDIVHMTQYEEKGQKHKKLNKDPTKTVFNGVSVTRSLVLYVCFVDCCLSFCT